MAYTNPSHEATNTARVELPDGSGHRCDRRRRGHHGAGGEPPPLHQLGRRCSAVSQSSAGLEKRRSALPASVGQPSTTGSGVSRSPGATATPVGEGEAGAHDIGWQRVAVGVEPDAPHAPVGAGTDVRQRADEVEVGVVHGAVGTDGEPLGVAGGDRRRVRARREQQPHEVPVEVVLRDAPGQDARRVQVAVRCRGQPGEGQHPVGGRGEGLALHGVGHRCPGGVDPAAAAGRVRAGGERGREPLDAQPRGLGDVDASLVVDGDRAGGAEVGGQLAEARRPLIGVRRYGVDFYTAELFIIC